MAERWTTHAKKGNWLLVEQAALWAEQQLGLIPAGTHELSLQVEVTDAVLARADELEQVNDHDLIAFILAITELLPEPVRPYFHRGLTSYDTEDTGMAMTLRDSLDDILHGLRKLRDKLVDRAQAFRRTPMMARTHFIHAEPTVFGLKLLYWADIIDRHVGRVAALHTEVSVGKVSGAVGMYVLDPRIEELVCQHLGLRPARISTQIISRDILAHYIATLVAVANSLDKMATDIRLLAGTDIGEVAEFKRPGAKGSSAMPSKSFLRNPIKSENICALAKLMRGYLIPGFEIEQVWLERTLDNSGAERVMVPDATMLIDFMIHRFTDTITKLEVYPDRMLANLRRTGGIVFAQRVMMALTEKGMTRADAYDLLEVLAMSVNRETFRTADGKQFRDLVNADPGITGLLSADEIAACFDPQNSLRFVDDIYRRFGL